VGLRLHDLDDEPNTADDDGKRGREADEGEREIDRLEQTSEEEDVVPALDDRKDEENDEGTEHPFQEGRHVFPLSVDGTGCPKWHHVHNSILMYISQVL
jgi:hypothetical protein